MVNRDSNGRFVKGNSGVWLGRSRSEETKRKISLAQKGISKPRPKTINKFKCINCEVIFIPKSHGKVYKFCSQKCNKAFYTGEKNNMWKGGITEENHKIRTSAAYREWRMQVFRRDRFSCVSCGYRSKKSKDIVADHIKPFSLFLELRLEVSNGRTLCKDCDKILGWNFIKEGGMYYGTEAVQAF